MRIVAIAVHQVDLPLKEDRYAFADGRSVSVFDSTVVRVETDAGIVGVGEVCPLGPAYLPASGPGARTTIGEIAPALLGRDPRDVAVLADLMDLVLKGHPHAKSALDMAFWDILGKAAGMPVCRLLGGRFGEAVVLYRAIGQRPAAEMAENVARYRAEGYTRFQLKVGGEADEDVARIRACRAAVPAGDRMIADANTGWLAADALRVVKAVADLDVFVEQPCADLAGCLAVRERTALPFVLDELIDGVPALLAAHARGAMDMVNLKISKVGGLTRARAVRDACVALSIPMIVEDSWGGDVATAAIAHLAHSTPERLRFAATDFNAYGSRTIADGAPVRRDGAMAASGAPGLGVTLRPEAIGEPLAVYR